jgi:hypothetical protein
MHIGEVFCKIPGETRRSEKITQFFKELSKQPKIAKISTSKGKFERAKHPHKTTFGNSKIPTKKTFFETACLGKNAEANSCPICHHFFGLLHLLKNYNELSKVAQ